MREISSGVDDVQKTVGVCFLSSPGTECIQYMDGSQSSDLYVCPVPQSIKSCSVYRRRVVDGQVELHGSVYTESEIVNTRKAIPGTRDVIKVGSDLWGRCSM